MTDRADVWDVTVCDLRHPAYSIRGRMVCNDLMGGVYFPSSLVVNSVGTEH